MRVRRNFLPRRFVDILCFLVIGVFLPIVFIFEMIVVLPVFHEPGGFWHTFTVVIGIFILFNIKGNMIACMMIDTSVDDMDFKSLSSGDCNLKGWRKCEKCGENKLAPPRSWHCDICRKCILKRDHHCIFTGYCVGYRNHRYFMIFIIFLLIGATYAFVYNSLYLWVLNERIFRNWLSLLKMVCPLLMLVTGSTWHNAYLMFYNLNILALCYGIVLVGYHLPTVCRGGVSFERGKGFPYNHGWKKNLESVFGKRMHLVWLCPFVKSELPNNGIEWKMKQK